MPKNKHTPQIYKTETQLKEEALKRRETENLTARPKTEFQRKHENFWYHYKWHTIAAAFALFLAVLFIQDMFFRTKPDATVIVISERFWGEDDLSLLTSGAEEFATDYNGDGKVTISADFITLPRPEGESAQDQMAAPDLTGGQQDMANSMKLMTVLAAGVEPIYLMDPAAYDYIANRVQDESESDQIFETLSVSAEKLSGELPAVFDDMRFYLRSAVSDEIYYQYCKQLLENLDRS